MNYKPPHSVKLYKKLLKLLNQLQILMRQLLKKIKKTCPKISSKKKEQIAKFIFIPKIINSIDIKKIIKFIRFKTIPKNDIIKKLIIKIKEIPI